MPYYQTISAGYSVQAKIHNGTTGAVMRVGEHDLGKKVIHVLISEG
jgi:hypothetical protein